MPGMAARESAPIFPPAGRRAGRNGRVRARRSVSVGGWSRSTGGAGLLREPGSPAEPAERGVKETPRSPSEPCRTLSRHTAPRWMACVNRYRPRSRLAEPSITVWRLGRCTFGAFQTRRRIISQGRSCHSDTGGWTTVLSDILTPLRASSFHPSWPKWADPPRYPTRPFQAGFARLPDGLRGEGIGFLGHPATSAY